MKHLLDNPVWAALTSGNASLASGQKSAKYFSKDVSLFAGVEENTAENFKLLYETIPFDDPVAIFTDSKMLDPAPWTIIKRIDGYQMVYPSIPEPDNKLLDFVKLTDQNVPEMLRLTNLTNPGPFLPRTIDFENYEGIFRNDSLVAMAGWRFHSGNNIEISAVCTHPEYTGKGYARNLILNQVRKIQESGEIAYLHVRADNNRAIKIYRSMSFEMRNEMIIYFIKKNKLTTAFSRSPRLTSLC